jgi:hypothetical protein
MTTPYRIQTPTFRDEWSKALLSAVADRNHRLPTEAGDAIGAALTKLLDSDDPYTRVIAVQMVAKSLFDQAGDVRSSAYLLGGLAAILLGWDRSAPLWAITTQTLLTAFAARAVDAGMVRELHEKAPAFLEVLHSLDSRDESGHVSDLRLKQVEALMTDGYYEKAHEVLTLLNVKQLRRDGLLKRPDEKPEPVDGTLVIQQTLDYLATSKVLTPLARIVKERGKDFESGMLGVPAFPSVPKHFEALDAQSQQLDTSRTPLMALQAVSQGTMALLTTPGNGENEYLALAKVAERVIAAADGFNYWKEAVTAAWMLTVALRRAGRQHEALRHLLALAARIDQRRRLIHDPRLRAGVAIYLPHLPWVLAATAILAEDPPAALYGMEVAKARILGDLRLGEAAQFATPESLHQGLRARLATRPRVHLLSFLSDSTVGTARPGLIGFRALLLSANGTLHTAEIPLSEQTVEAVAKTIQELIELPQGRRDLMPIFVGDPWRRPFEPVLAALTPLFAWIEPLLNDGVLQPGDTLVVAADGSLHNIPFAMLPLGGKPLIETFAVAAMPSLALALDEKEVSPPPTALAALAPMPNEVEAGRDFREEIAKLKVLLPTEIVTSMEEMQAALARSPAGLIHFATHGIFDEKDPLRRGGLVMNYDDRGNPQSFLSPEILSQGNLQGKHLTIRACVVGQMRQITSREALGAVWALLSAGTASLVAASWNVDAPSAARWCNYFYEAWWEKKQSRAQAHRTACLALRKEGGAFAHPCYWAPFVLYAGTLEGDIV